MTSTNIAYRDEYGSVVNKPIARVMDIATPYEDLLRHILDHGTPKGDRTAPAR